VIEKGYYKDKEKVWDWAGAGRFWGTEIITTFVGY
jgi:hypothetical protein